MNDNIKITAVNIELTEEIKDYIYKKLGSLEKFINFEDPAVSVDIRLIREVRKQQTGKIYRIEISIMTPGKKFGVNSSGNSEYEAIDTVKDTLLRKISGYKEKKHSLVKKGGAKVKNFLKSFRKNDKI